MKKIHVKNMISSNGNSVPNQFIIKKTVAQGYELYFQSYDSIIACRTASGKIRLDKNFWDYSVTTGKYRNQFLNETKKETEAKIKSGVYKLKDLN